MLEYQVYLLLKAYEIRLRNIEISIRNISEKIESFGEATLDLPWFQNEESIKMIRKLFDLVNYENDKEKAKHYLIYMP